MSISVAHRLYLLASTLAGPIARPILNKRLARGKEDPDRIMERLGVASVTRPKGTVIWMHGASVGEAMSMLPLMHALLEERRDANILITTGTVTSAERLANLLPDRAVHQFVPVDTRSAVREFLDHWRPDLAIWVESELWPRLVTDTARRGIPMALVNARFSERSVTGWRRAPGMLRNLLASFDLIRTQDRETQDRLIPFNSGAQFGGNLKALVEPPGCDATELEAIRHLVGERPVWLAASTHADDEPKVLNAHRALLDQSENARPLLVLAPRHPDRNSAIEQANRQAGLTVAVRSKDEQPSPDTDVWLADTMGEMGLWYRLAPVTFVGGSFGSEGGHTPFEPILLDSVVLHGPRVANFASTYDALSQAGGARRLEASASGFTETLHQLLTDSPARETMLKAAHDVHAELKPDLDALVKEVLTVMEEA